MTPRRWLWLVPALLYGAFWLWYTPLGGPLSDSEIDHYASLLAGGDPARVAVMRRFMAEDTGEPFLMVNLIEMAQSPPELPATGPGADADALLGHYMAHMYPELARRASHPVFAGRAVSQSLDLVGIDGAETWTQAALMRYRSRRDLMEIATNPAFRERHDYKLAALAKTIAFPVAPQLYLGDPRLLLALGLLALIALLDLALFRRARGR